MAVISPGTVGFGEVIDLSHHPGGRLFSMAFVVVGDGFVAYPPTWSRPSPSMGQFLWGFDRRRMLKMLAQLQDHSIARGDDATASHVAEELIRSGRKPALVGPSEDALAPLQEATEAAPGMVGDPTTDAKERALIEQGSKG